MTDETPNSKAKIINSYLRETNLKLTQQQIQTVEQKRHECNDIIYIKYVL